MKKSSQNTPTVRARPKRVFAGRALTSFVISEKKSRQKADMPWGVAPRASRGEISIFDGYLFFGKRWTKWLFLGEMEKINWNSRKSEIMIWHVCFFIGPALPCMLAALPSVAFWAVLALPRVLVATEGCFYKFRALLWSKSRSQKIADFWGKIARIGTKTRAANPFFARQ